MIAHLQGREQALEPFGWTGRRAKWIALACLHGGVFTRAQWTSFLGCHHEHVRRAVHALVAQGAAIEENPPGIAGIGRVCRIHRRGIYRALDAEDIRHRRIASKEVLMRRLLAFDYVLDHPQLPWLPTEPEKMAAFEALSVECRLLPRRVYRGAAGNLRRYFPLRLPVALDAERAVFVYVDPGHETATALRSWGAAHRELWEALWDRGRGIEVVVVVRTTDERGRAETVLANWARDPHPSEFDHEIGREIDRIDRAIIKGDVRVLMEYGGLQAANEAQRRAVEACAQASGSGADAAHRHMADGSARGRAIPMRSLRLVPYWSVHETLGVDAHNAPLKMRTRRIHLSRAVAWSCVRRHPVAGAALGSTDVDGSDPPARGPGTGAGPCAFSRARPRPLGGRSRPNIPGGKATERR